MRSRVVVLALALGLSAPGCATAEQRAKTTSTVTSVYRVARQICTRLLQLPAPPPVQAPGGEAP